MIEDLFDLEAAAYYVSFEALAFLVEALILLWIGKLIKDKTSSFNINEELTHKDNKALAVSYTGYMVAQGVILLGTLNGPSNDFVPDLISVGIWGLVGIVLLNIAMLINDKIILGKFNNTKELIEDQNIGTGAVQCGSFIGTAFLIQAVLSSDGVHDYETDTWYALIFFAAGQIGFILFSLIYSKLVSFDLHDEIEKDNVAAGVGFGLTLAAVGVLMSNTIHATHSLAAFLVWFFTGMFLLIVTRFLVDKLILPNHKLDSEICEDRNWGAALIEGACAFIVAFLLNASFA